MALFDNNLEQGHGVAGGDLPAPVRDEIDPEDDPVAIPAVGGQGPEGFGG